MGASSLTKLGRLYWLGRYVTRVSIETEIVEDIFDKVIDNPDYDYVGFCDKLEIPSDDYANANDFIERFLLDKDDPFSVITNVSRAYDNAIVLRETISSEALSYIQGAVNLMDTAAKGMAPMLEMQGVRDALYAFRGCVDDTLYDNESRYTLKAGSSVERIDMYVRLGLNTDIMTHELDILRYRLRRMPLTRDGRRLALLEDLAPNPSPVENRALLLDCIEGLFPDM